MGTKRCLLTNRDDVLLSIATTSASFLGCWKAIVIKHQRRFKRCPSIYALRVVRPDGHNKMLRRKTI